MMFGKCGTYAQLFELFSHDFFVGKKRYFLLQILRIKKIAMCVK